MIAGHSIFPSAKFRNHTAPENKNVTALKR